MRQAALRLIVGFAVLATVLGLIFAISAASESEWVGAGICLIGSSAAALVAGRTLERHIEPRSI